MLALSALLSPCWTDTDCQSTCYYPIALVALLTYFPPLLQMSRQNQERTSLATYGGTVDFVFPDGKLPPRLLQMAQQTGYAQVLQQIVNLIAAILLLCWRC